MDRTGHGLGTLGRPKPLTEVTAGIGERPLLRRLAPALRTKRKSLERRQRAIPIATAIFAARPRPRTSTPCSTVWRPFFPLAGQAPAPAVSVGTKSTPSACPCWATARFLTGGKAVDLGDFQKRPVPCLAVTASCRQTISKSPEPDHVTPPPPPPPSKNCRPRKNGLLLPLGDADRRQRKTAMAVAHNSAST